MEFTDAQKEAITAKDPFIIVSAAAGSGKTRVLTERVVSRLCGKDEKYDISRFLVVTFTRAAAAEMRTRIASSLSERISKGEEGSDRLRRQLAKLPTARIQTVDAFCADFVRRHFDLCGVPSDFGICDSLTAEDLKSKALFTLLEETYEKAPAGFVLLRLSVCGERSDKTLEETLIKAYDKIQSHPDPAAWIRRRRDEEGLPVFKTGWGSFILEQAKRLSFPVINRWENAKAVSDRDPVLAERNAHIITVTDALCSALKEIKDPPDLSPYVKCLSDYEAGIKGKALRHNVPDKDAYARFKKERDACVDAKKKLFAFITGCTADPDAFENLPSREAAACFCDMLLRFDELYSAEKRAKKLLDYGDLEHMTLSALRSHPETAEELRSELCELLVDEYQDTNEVQDEIFRLIAPEHGSSFFVGDVKQSIYGFRLADPSIFLRRYREATPDGKNGKKRIDMSRNFRSRPEVIGLCNNIFGKIMSDKLGGIDYDSSQALVFGREHCEGVLPSELCVIDKEGLSESDEDDSYTALEAEYAAERILKLLPVVRVGLKDGGTRAAVPDDFAILLSSYRSNVGFFIRALEKKGIPCAADSEKDFTECAEGKVIYSLLKIIDNPRQDVPLLAVLYSPLFSFTPDELALLREDRYCDLIDSVTLAAKNGNEKAGAFLKKLSEWTFLSRLTTASRLLQKIYSDTDAYGVFSALPAAQTRRQTLDLFYDLALSRENGSFCSLYDFISYLEKAELSKSKPVFSSGSGVHVMSIHRSKGLEFPFVFVCMLDKEFNADDAKKDPVLIDRDVGLALKFVDRERRIKRPSGKSIAVKEKLLSELKNEEMRKLYVAMTRAREGLFLILSIKDPAARISEIYDCCRGEPSPDYLSSFKSCGTWILSALLNDPDAGPLMSLTRDAGKKTSAPRGSLVCTVTDWRTVYEKAEKENGACAPKETEPPKEPESADISAHAALAEKAYAFSDVSALPSKITPAAIAEKGFPVFDVSVVPSGADRDEARRRGTALHLFLSRASLEKCATPEGVAAEKERLSALSKDISSVDENTVLRFTRSDIGARAAAASGLMREYRFGVLLSPARIPELKSSRGDEKILVNGSVDMLFFEKNGAVIIDFKTDSVRPGTEAQAAEKHRPQLRLYAEAIREVFETPVAETVVFFLKTGAAVSL